MLVTISVDRAIYAGDWLNAGIYSGNLSEMQLLVGRISPAVDSGKRAVEFADQSEEQVERVRRRTNYAHALHQSGRFGESYQYFTEAEAIQAKETPGRPLLCSLYGAWYCDLLLAQAERAAWKSFLGVGAAHLVQECFATCESVSARAIQMLNSSRNRSLLDVALARLVLVRARLAQAMIEHSASCPSELHSLVSAAVNDLRRAGQQQEVPPGLLTKAWLHCLVGELDMANTDLDEAVQICERGPMRLHLVDVHLQRARLFRSKEELRIAQRLMDSCGYSRRREEIEDVFRAAGAWAE